MVVSGLKGSAGRAALVDVLPRHRRDLNSRLSIGKPFQNHDFDGSKTAICSAAVDRGRHGSSVCATSDNRVAMDVEREKCHRIALNCYNFYSG
jgi:hypothetical protein